MTAGFVAGAVIYRYSFGRLFVKYMTLILQFLLRPLKMCIKFIIIKFKHLIVKVKSRKEGLP